MATFRTPFKARFRVAWSIMRLLGLGVRGQPTSANVECASIARWGCFLANHMDVVPKEVVLSLLSHVSDPESHW